MCRSRTSLRKYPTKTERIGSYAISEREVSIDDILQASGNGKQMG